MNVLVLGCGKTGVRLARLLASRGNDVSVIDPIQSKLDMLGDSFTGITAAGETFDEDTLLAVGADNADVAVVVSADDNTNMMASQLLRLSFGLEKIYTRVLDPEKAEMFRNMGFETICSTEYEVQHLFSKVTEHDADFNLLDIFGTAVEFEILETDRGDLGKTVGELELMPGEMVFGVVGKNGVMRLANEAGLCIQKGDKVALVKTANSREMN